MPYVENVVNYFIFFCQTAEVIDYSLHAMSTYIAT